jgi:nucleoside 2-deoxyribosyltransferase
MKKIYIAGPDVFEKNSIEIGKQLSALCEKYGFEGSYPLDNVIDFNQSKQKIAQDIYEANLLLIKESDIIIANLNNFRGYEADSGTIWECGFAHALGKEVYGYLSRKGAYIDQFEEAQNEDEIFYDENALMIENFDHPLNLMIACSCKEIIEGSFEDVLQRLQN